MRGTFKGVAIDYDTRKLIVSFEVDSCEPGEWKNKDLDITVEEHKEKRGDPQNKYFHKLCDLLRQKLNISFNACKNHLIASYGQVKYLPNGDIETIKTNIEPGTVNEWAFVHWELIRVTENAYFYRVHRPTHELNTAEFAQLIRGTVEECKAQGIETMTPQELERLKKEAEKWQQGAKAQKPKAKTESLN